MTLQVGDQAPLEARPEAFFDIGHILWEPVAGQDDLFVGLVQGVERMEELFLGPFFPGQELNVVDHQHVDVPVALAEVRHLVVPDRVDHFVRELLRRQVGDAQIRVL